MHDYKHHDSARAFSQDGYPLWGPICLISYRALPGGTRKTVCRGLKNWVRGSDAKKEREEGRKRYGESGHGRVVRLIYIDKSSAWQSVAECCRVLQSVAECCRVLQYTVQQRITTNQSSKWIPKTCHTVTDSHEMGLMLVMPRCASLQLKGFFWNVLLFNTQEYHKHCVLKRILVSYSTWCHASHARFLFLSSMRLPLCHCPSYWGEDGCCWSDLCIRTLWDLSSTLL